MPYKFAKNGGIIDWFDLAMTATDLISKARAAEGTDAYGPLRAKTFEDQIERAIQQIKTVLFDRESEYPHTIRFFTIPNFDTLNFDVYAIAKVNNNGITYVFGNDRGLIDSIASDGETTIELK